MEALQPTSPAKYLIFNAFCAILAEKSGFYARFSPASPLLLLLFFGISGLFSPVAPLQAQGRNPYNLPLTTSSKAYLQQLDSNPMLQMVNLEKRIPGLRTDIRYATAQNFTRQVLYYKPAVFLRKAAADKLAMVQDSLQKFGLAILVFDGYR
ncbi:MAG: hypothetical protein MUF29_07020, partial [Chitinophagaceae bacterium]|nr:hypothetical protein [Chitinophagaceae bacterium]